MINSCPSCGRPIPHPVAPWRMICNECGYNPKGLAEITLDSLEKQMTDELISRMAIGDLQPTEDDDL